MFDRIPRELTQYRQWVIWRYEDRGGPKLTKVPYDPKSLWKADVTDSSTWTTFEEAKRVCEERDFSGIGFVLSSHDPYCFVDLDEPKGDSEAQKLAWERQKKIFNVFNSYSELSPSGKGLHIIVRANVKEGRRRADVECYSAERFMTMTGRVEHDVPIAERQQLITTLWDELGEGRGQYDNSMKEYNQPQEHSDDEICEIAAKASNGNKFVDLWQGNWSQYNYPSQSEADFALVDIIAYYTQNREQVARMFKASAMGARNKTDQNPKYLPTMITRAFDKVLPPVNIDALKKEFERVLDAQRFMKPNSDIPQYDPAKIDEDGEPDEPVAPAHELYSVPPGLVGSIARFIYDSAPRPVPEIALMAALGLMAGICGRCYNVSNTGLNQYLLVLAPTGCGKEAAASGIEKLLTATSNFVVANHEFIGPAEIASPQALIKYLSNNSKSFVSIVGEFGLKLQQLTSEQANTNDTGLRRLFLDLFNKSGQGNKLRPSIYADKQNNTDVVDAPAFSMLGESTPERFYGALSEEMISEGFLPRFTIVEYHGDRPPANRAHSTARPSDELVTHLAELMAYSLSMNQKGDVVDVAFDDDALEVFDEFDRFCDKKINTAARETVRNMWNRGHIKAMKLAALIAVGYHPYAPRINLAMAEWAVKLVKADAANILARFNSGNIGGDTGEVKQADSVIAVIADYLTKPWEMVSRYGSSSSMHRDKIVPYQFLQRKLVGSAAFRKDRRGATDALKRTLQMLVDSGDLVVVNRMKMSQQYETQSVAYGIASPMVFLRNASKKGIVK